MFRSISKKEAIDFLLPRHYSGRKPNIIYAFGVVENNEIVATCTFGKPASNSLCEGVCGKNLSSKVIELNRLCREEYYREPLSKFVGYCLRELKDKNLIIVSYSDTAMKHNGYIYQATNFYYTGQTEERTDKYTEGNKHSRHYKNHDNSKRKIRSAKNRYIYFAGDKRFKKQCLKALNYEIQPYPKAENQNYELGHFQEIEIIDNGEHKTIEVENNFEKNNQLKLF